MNTRLSYRYADKTNCRQYTSIVVAGTITWDQIGPYLSRQTSFIPGKIGLEDLQYRFALPGMDHPWHQIATEDVQPTEALPTIAVTAEELIERFAQVSWEGTRIIVPDVAKTNMVKSSAPAQAVALAADVSAQGAASDEGASPIRTTSTRVRKTAARTK